MPTLTTFFQFLINFLNVFCLIENTFKIVQDQDAIQMSYIKNLMNETTQPLIINSCAYYCQLVDECETAVQQSNKCFLFDSFLIGDKLITKTDSLVYYKHNEDCPSEETLDGLYHVIMTENLIDYYLTVRNTLSMSVYMTFGAKGLLTTVSKWKITFVSQLINCEKLYHVQNVIGDEYLQTGDNSIFDSERRYVFTATLASQYSFNNLGRLWVISKNFMNGYYFKNYHTTEYMYISTGYNRTFTWIPKYTADEFRRNFTLKKTV